MGEALIFFQMLLFVSNLSQIIWGIKTELNFNSAENVNLEPWREDRIAPNKIDTLHGDVMTGASILIMAPKHSVNLAFEKS